jgi:hypothetical protein
VYNSIVDLAYHDGITDCWPAGGLSDLRFSIAVLASQHETAYSNTSYLIYQYAYLNVNLMYIMTFCLKKEVQSPSRCICYEIIFISFFFTAGMRVYGMHEDMKPICNTLNDQRFFGFAYQHLGS